MYHENKSEFRDGIVPTDLDNCRPVTTAALVNGALLIQMLPSRSVVNIADYFTEECLP